MTNINKKISDISTHLQTLTTIEFSNQVEKAVEKNDKALLVKICKKAKIPGAYIGTVTSVILSVSPQKWPDNF